MTWFKMPLMVWALYATAIIQVLATPVLGITLFMLIIERLLGIGIFNPAFGGIGFISALFLVLLAPSCLHYGLTSNGNHERISNNIL